MRLLTKVGFFEKLNQINLCGDPNTKWGFSADHFNSKPDAQFAFFFYFLFFLGMRVMQLAMILHGYKTC